MRAIRKVTGSPRARVTSAGLIVGGMLTYAAVGGAAGATGAADTTITALGQGNPPASRWEPAGPVVINTGETVTWHFADPTHNVVSENTHPTDPRWESFVYPGPGQYDTAPAGSSRSYTFYKQGTYEFICTIHTGGSFRMGGTVVVQGEDMEIPVETATPSPSATATATATPTATPTPPPHDDHLSTPPPTPDADTTKPTLSRVKLRAARRAARVTFTLSEHATVTLQVRKRGKKKVLRALAVQARAGTRTVVIRSPKLRKGRYTVALTARDAMGNTSATSTSALRIRK